MSNNLPYPDMLAKAMSPISYMKWKMNVIDNARVSYEQCSFEFEKIRHLMNLPENFESWFSITILHVWMIHKRLLQEGDIGKELYNEIVSHIWLDVEIKLHQAGVRADINNIVKDLVFAFQGQVLAYDEGFYYGDAIFAAALWRNIYVSMDVDPQHLTNALKIIRQQLQHVDSTEREVFLEGKFKFKEIDLLN
ncbi:ubiquinol-cytochrome C chaperone-domain-containing protein [Globomyces pollinis-pini]|nr:ubiquinol-cytochrome C chaperone-domain-containing protein [Globomyces pollinis-pini]